jgi:hypothetical protein
VAGAIVLALVGACNGPSSPVPVGQIQSPAPATPSESPTPSPTPTADAAVTTQVCLTVNQATEDATVVVNDQLTVLEHAAASGDQPAMVAAAEAINKQFTTLSAYLATQSQVFLLEPAVQATLTDVSEALAEMASPRYIGTMVDIKKEMIEFAAAFTASCDSVA